MEVLSIIIVHTGNVGFVVIVDATRDDNRTIGREDER